MQMPDVPADVRQYIAAVLWVHGRTIGEIAGVVGWTRNQTKAFTNRLLPGKMARSYLTDEERVEILGHFAADRHDGDRLREEHFKPIPIRGAPRQRTRSEAIIAIEESWGACLLAARQIGDPAARREATRECNDGHRRQFADAGVAPADIPDPGTVKGRREVREMERRAAAKRDKEEQDRMAREAGGATRRERPLEYLFWRRMLADGNAAGMEKLSEEMRRYEAGERLQRYIVGARLSALGAIDMERASMGGGSPVAMTPTAHKLFCVQSIGRIRGMMSTTDYLMLEAVLDQDVFLWEREPPNSRARSRVLDSLRRLLDVVAVYESLMATDSFKDRWDHDLTPPDAPSLWEARAQAENIADLMETAR